MDFYPQSIAQHVGDSRGGSKTRWDSKDLQWSVPGETLQEGLERRVGSGPGGLSPASVFAESSDYFFNSALRWMINWLQSSPALIRQR